MKTRRNQLRMTQDDLARELQLAGFDVIRSTVSHWEKGRVTPPLNNPSFVLTRSRILRLDPASVLRESGYVLETRHSAIGERIAQIVDRMSPDKQMLALRLIESLTESEAEIG